MAFFTKETLGFCSAVIALTAAANVFSAQPAEAIRIAQELDFGNRAEHLDAPYSLTIIE